LTTALRCPYTAWREITGAGFVLFCDGKATVCLLERGQLARAQHKWFLFVNACYSGRSEAVGTEQQAPRVRVVREHERHTEVASGAMTRQAGISATTVGAQGIYLCLSVVPPGQQSSPHLHTNCESGIYVLRGRGIFRAGEGLREEWRIGPGDFIHVPAGAPHQPVNDGDEPLELIVARNAQEEIVEDYPAQPGQA